MGLASEMSIKMDGIAKGYISNSEGVRAYMCWVYGRWNAVDSTEWNQLHFGRHHGQYRGLQANDDHSTTCSVLSIYTG